MSEAPHLIYSRKYAIRSYEPRSDGHVGITTLCNYLQDIATRHADTLGFGYNDLAETGHFWVLARLHIMIKRLPHFPESISVETWPSGNERLVALRDFILSDSKETIGTATTSWVTLNKNTHRADKPETVLGNQHFPHRDHALIFPSKAVPRLKQALNPMTLVAQRADMDINNHVNNVRYIELCFEALPHQWIESYQCHGIDIQFRNESHAGDIYTAAYAESGIENDMHTLSHSLIRTADNKEIVRMRSWWVAK